MRKTALLALGLMFAATQMASALPAGPGGTSGHTLTAASADGQITLVRSDKKKKTKKAKRSSKPSGGMNMQGMPPGHRM